MKYKVGDRVRVREEEAFKCGNYYYFPQEMRCYMGKIVTIASVWGASGYIEYTIKEDSGNSVWPGALFEGKVDSIMTKSDLKTGMIVTTRDGSEYWVLKDNTTGYDSFVDVNYKKCIPFHSYSEDFKCYIHPEKSDIIKIEEPEFFNPKASRVLLWEREEIKEVTMEEVEKKFGCKVKIVN